MARQPRVHYEGAIYHITARGNNRDNIFHDEDDKAEYLTLINRYKEKFAFRLYAYVIMDNHIHLLLQVGKNSVSQIMQGVQQSYTLYYNHKYCHVGHVFQQRYLAKLCNKDGYLLTIVKYIHNNPVKAGISKNLNYEWSSHRFYLGQQGIVDSAFILSLFAGSRGEALSRYIKYMDVTETAYTIPDAAYSEESTVIGDTGPQTINVTTLLIKLCQELNVSARDVCGVSRLNQIVRARKIFVYLAIINNASNKDIADMLNVHPSSVTRAFSSVLRDQQLKEASERLYGSIS